MKIHDVKSWPEYFQPTVNGTKTCDIRTNDRDYKLGDHLLQREWKKNGAHSPMGEPLGDYTGRTTMVSITHIFTDSPELMLLEPNVVVLSIKKVPGGNC